MHRHGFQAFPARAVRLSQARNVAGLQQRFARYLVASQLAEDGEVVQVISLIYSMGAEAEHILKSFTFAANGDKYDVVMAKFDEHFIPKRNVIYERAKFHSRAQLSGESVEAFVAAL